MNKGLNIGVLLAALLCLVLFTLQMGSVETDLMDVLNSFFYYNQQKIEHFSIVQLRLPRVLMAFTVGASLSLSGYLLQLIIRNPLADPYILGTSSAASFGANIVLFLSSSITLGIYSQFIGGFIFALFATFIVVKVASEKGKVYTSKLLLAGIAMSSLTMAGVSIMTFYAESDKLRSIIFWIMGSLENSRYNHVAILFSIWLLTFLYLSLRQKDLNMLILGESNAKHMGFKDKSLSWIVISMAVLLTATSVSFVGPIGFVGLIVPHVVRAYNGSTHPSNLISVSLSGGIFLVVADAVSKLMYPPLGLPIGVICSLFGVPFFVYLLRKRNFRFE